MELEMYTLDKTQLEDMVDIAKVAIVTTLVDQGLLKENDADEWCANHTIIIKKKSFFRTLSDKWKKEEDTKGILFIVVKKV